MHRAKRQASTSKMTSHDSTSHAEMWDDSALVDSWNEALEEYKHYHGIHARGETVEDVLKTSANKGKGGDEDIEYEEGQVDDDDQPLTAANAKNTPAEAGGHSMASHGNISRMHSQPPSTEVLPQHLIGQVHDEGLKNLLMSWYYAGYYTGLYEGQKQGALSKHGKHMA